MNARKSVAVVALLTLGVGAVVVWSKWGKEPERGPEFPSLAEQAGSKGGAEARLVPEKPESSGESPGTVRDAVPAVAWMGRVVGPDGTGLAEAELSWGALRPEWVRLEKRLFADHGAELLARQRRVTSEAGGRFVFDEAPEGAEEHGSVVWVSALGCRSKALVVGKGASSLPGEIVLEPDPALLVRVVDGGGAAVAGAEVLHFLNARPGSPEELRAPENVARKLYLRTARTDGKGECRVGAAEGRFMIYARLGERLTAPVFQEGGAAVTLVLRETFTLEGRVLAPRAGLLEEEAFLAVYGMSRLGKAEGMQLLGGRISYREDGSFGPLQLPWVPELAGLRLRAGGGPLLESYVERAMPRAGESIFVSLELVLGQALLVEVVDASGKPVAKADAQASVTPTWNSFVTASYGRTDEAGRVRLGVPASQAFVIGVRAEGLAQTTVGPLLHSKELDPLRITLQPAGGLRLRLTRRGEPVTSYRLSFWQGDPRKGWQERCADPGGVATIADLAPGSYSVQASAEEWPQTKPLTFTVEPGKLTECELAIPEPVAARGQVIDAQTGEPLPSARVMLHHSVGSSLSWPRDIEIELDSQGRFELTQIGEAGGAVMVSAAGYAVAVENYRWDGRPDALARVIALQRRSPLEVIVTQASEEPFKGYFVSSLLGLSLAPVPLPANGLLVLPEQSPSAALICLHLPDGSTIQQWVAIASQPHNRVRFRVGGTASLAIELGSGDGARRLAGGELLLRPLDRVGEVARALRIPDQPQFTLRGLHAGEYTLELRSPADVIVATRAVRLSEGAEQRIEVAGDTAASELLVVDAARQPLSGVKVEVVGGEPGLHWFVRGITTVDGRLELGSVPAGRVRIALDHDTLGLQRGRELELRAGRNELRFDAGASVEILVTENGEPKPGIVVLVEHPAHSAQARSKYTSDERGMLRTLACNDGVYRIFARHLGYWLEERELRVPSSAVVNLSLRPLGDLRLVALDKYDEPQRQVAVELECPELQATLREWIEAGRVALPEGGLETDSDGELLLRGLPAGEYRFRARAPGGESAAGSLRIAGRGESRVELPLR